MKPWDRSHDSAPYPGDSTAWFDSFAELAENIRDNDGSLNEVIGWEWHRAIDLTDVDYAAGYPETGEWFSVTVAMPRVRMHEDWAAPVGEQDETAVRQWLKEYGAARAARWSLPDD